MTDKLTRLYNTMLTIETKGSNTKTMAQCLAYLEMLIQENEQQDKNEENK